MAANLSGKRIAILATDGVEQVELLEPQRALKDADANVQVVSPKAGSIRGWNRTEWGTTIPVDLVLDEARAEDFDGLVIPGGVKNPDTLRMNERAVQFVRDFYTSGKPIAAICHAPWLLIEADVVRDRTVTSYPSLKTDLKNAGADWVDREVVTDEGIVTSRKVDDIPAFNRKMIEEFAEGRHDRADVTARKKSETEFRL